MIEREMKLYSGLFILVFMVLSILMGTAALWTASKKTSSPEAHRLIVGEWTREFEKNFDEVIGIKDFATDAWGILNFLLFREGKSGVLVGKDGWFFTSEEFMAYPDAEKNIEDKVEYVDDVRDLLESKGTKLVVVLVPAKSRVYQSKLGKYTYPSYNESVYQDFRRALKDREVPVVDVLWGMKKGAEDFDLFLKTDTHWTPSGARIGARQTRSLMEKEMPEMLASIASKDKVYEVARKEEIAYDGDLLRYVPLGALRKALGVKADTIKEVELLTKDKAPEQGKATAEASSEENSLFGDVSIPVTLVGTSYSANEMWGFASFLKEELQTDILNAADEGMGPFETMKKYLSDKAFIDSPPQLVVWEIPERYLAVKYDLTVQE